MTLHGPFLKLDSKPRPDGWVAPSGPSVIGRLLARAGHVLLKRDVPTARVDPSDGIVRIGAGVVVLLPTGVCPLVEVARVARYMEGEGAGQCGPCVNGLDVLASQLELLADRPQSLRSGLSAFPTLCGLVEGRGACHHPDGVARFVRSALGVFADHAALHLQRGPCQTTRPFLPVPSASGVLR